MSNFDIAVSIFLGVSLLYSLVKGMVREIFSILAYASGYFAASRFYGYATDHMGSWISNEVLANVVGFGLIFIAVTLMIKLIGVWLQGVLRSAAKLSGFDRFMGGILGVVKGLFVLGVAMIPLDFFPDMAAKVTRDSVLAPHLRKMSSFLRQNMFEQEKSGGKPLNFDLSVIKQKSGEIGKFKENLDVLEKLKQLPGEIKGQTKSILSKKDDSLEEHPQKSKAELENMIRSFQKD
ncbi:MAG: CvpA family protein [Nitrospinales bacterium]